MIELYGIWDGDFAESPKAQEGVSLKKILDSDFRLKRTRILPSQLGK